MYMRIGHFILKRFITSLIKNFCMTSQMLRIIIMKNSARCASCTKKMTEKNLNLLGGGNVPFIEPVLDFAIMSD